MAVRVPLLEAGKLWERLEELIARKGEPPWGEAMVLTDDMQAFIIAQQPGHPTDTHYHLHDEWWVMLKGEIDWWIEGQPEPIHAREGDFVLAPKLHNHHIEPVGSSLTIRLAINARGEFHRYDRPGCRSEPWRLKPGETPETAQQ
ncbi:MAG: cupin domain-containing protein [Chloroflexi bacterium]|nr:cupin domain-containing protein [Chloroflexota bacterium]